MNKSLLENDINAITKGLSGLLNSANSMISNVSSNLETDEEKKKFAEKFIQSGILKDLNKITEQFKDIHK